MKISTRKSDSRLFICKHWNKYWNVNFNSVVLKLWQAYHIVSEAFSRGTQAAEN